MSLTFLEAWRLGEKLRPEAAAHDEDDEDDTVTPTCPTATDCAPGCTASPPTFCATRVAPPVGTTPRSPGSPTARRTVTPCPTSPTTSSGAWRRPSGSLPRRPRSVGCAEPSGKCSHSASGQDWATRPRERPSACRRAPYGRGSPGRDSVYGRCRRRSWPGARPPGGRPGIRGSQVPPRHPMFHLGRKSRDAARAPDRYRVAVPKRPGRLRRSTDEPRRARGTGQAAAEPG